MERINADILDYYNNQVVNMIVEKYNYRFMDAFKLFACSKTHEMLENKEYGLYEFGAGAIMDMWECEQVTGSPLNSIYIRCE